jgi:hypothetical protein
MTTVLATTQSTNNTSIVNVNNIDSNENLSIINDNKKALVAANENKINSFRLRKEKEEFVQNLIDFHKHKNVNSRLISWPTFNGKPLDLHKLYNKVVSLGGWEKVCEKEQWDDVCMYLDPKLFTACTNGTHAIKLVYIRYLSLFEKVNFTLNSNASGLTNGQIANNYKTTLSIYLDSAQFISSLNQANQLNGLLNSSSQISLNGLVDDKDDDLISALKDKRKFSYLLDGIPLNYSYLQHFSSSMPSSSYLSFNPYEKLEISLASGLLNEIDFVFNTLLILSSDEAHAFRLYQSPRLIHLMLAHVGHFGSEDKYNLRYLYENVWFKPIQMYNLEVENELQLEQANATKKLKEIFITNDSGEKIIHDHNRDNDDDDDDDDDDDFDDFYNKRILKRLKKIAKRDYIHFWHESFELQLDEYENKDDTRLTNNQQNLNYLKAMLSNLLPKYTSVIEDTETDHNDLNLFEENESYEVELKRIEQVLVILNNLSFEEENADFMANKCEHLLEFLIMCLYCTKFCKRTHSSSINKTPVDLRKYSLDILISISRKLKLKNISESIRNVLLISIVHLMNSSNNSDIVCAVEILTKLCSQTIEFLEVTTSESLTNELLITQFTYLNDFYLNRIVVRFEYLLSMQNVVVILHVLECLYNMSQHNKAMCNIIVNRCANLISLLVNYLTVDMSNFDMMSDEENGLAQLKMYKFTAAVSSHSSHQHHHHQQHHHSNSQSHHHHQHHIQTTNQTNTTPSSNQTKSLLQQTLNNQHSSSLNANSNNNKINSISNHQQQQQIQAKSNTPTSSQDAQAARNILQNWLLTCFHGDGTSELSKTQLYPYYQQISKLNNWPVLNIAIFFDILNSTFPNLKYDEPANKIVGLKLILNVKQQLQLRTQMQFQEPSLTQNQQLTGSITNSPQLSSLTVQASRQQAQKEQQINNEPKQSNDEEKQQTDENNRNASPPPPFLSINISAPAIPSILTPPTPPVPVESTIQNGSNTDLDNETKKSTTNDCTTININENNVENKMNDAPAKEVKLSNGYNSPKETAQVEQENVKPANESIKINGHLSTDSKEIEDTNNENNPPKQILNGNSEHHNHINNHNQIIENNKLSLKTNEENGFNHENELKRKVNEQQDPVLEADVNNLKRVKVNGTEPSSSSTPSSSSSDAQALVIQNSNPTEFQQKSSTLDSQLKAQLSSQTTNSQIQTQVAQNLSITSTQNSQISTTSLLPSVQNNNNYSSSNVSSDSSSINSSSAIVNALTNGNSIDQNYNTGDYMCEWNNCRRLFRTSKAVYNHVCKFHLLNSNLFDSHGSLCLWSNCDQIKRQKWSLVNHLLEKHCNENVLKTAFICRQRGIVPAISTNATSTLLNSYKDAAILTIQRHHKVKPEEFVVR